MTTNPKPRRIGKEASERHLTPVRPCPPGMRRYSLVIPEALYTELQERAAAEHTSMQDVMRRTMKFGLDMAKEVEEPGTSLVLEKEGRLKKLIKFYL
jgi:hypothetical protein